MQQLVGMSDVLYDSLLMAVTSGPGLREGSSTFRQQALVLQLYNHLDDTISIAKARCVGLP